MISREFGALFEEEIEVWSNDDKAKIVTGIPAVHRLNTLNKKFFLRDEGPNFPDHDVLRSGQLIVPRGYMLLRRKTTRGDQRGVEIIVVPIIDMNEESPTEELNPETNNPRSDISEEGENVERLDLLREELPLVTAEEEDFVDEIMQLDGTNDSSGSEEDEFEFDLFRGAQPQSKRARVESDEEDDPNVEESEEERENNSEPNSTAAATEEAEEDFEMPEFPGVKFVMKNGRKHVATAHTGPTYVFFASHQMKPSTISRHVNDILTISEADRSVAGKACQILLLDDGLDWGGRGLQTCFYFGELWRRLNLDLLIIARNAPGDSRHNPVEQ